MNKLLLVLILFLTQLCFSQNIIVDSESKKGIPYVNISIKNTTKGFYANDKGEFTLKEFIKKGDTLVFTVVGYQPKEIVYSNNKIPEKISLNRKIENLDEIVLKSYNKYEIEELGITKRKNNGWGWEMGIIKMAVFIKNDSTKENTGVIKKLVFRKIGRIFKKPTYNADTGTLVVEKSTKRDLAVKFQLYAIDTIKKSPNLELPLINKEVIIRLEKNTKKLKYDVSSLNLLMPKEGVFLCLEVLGFYNEKGEIEDSKLANIVRIGSRKIDNPNEGITYGKYKERAWSKRKSGNALFSIKVAYPEN